MKKAVSVFMTLCLALMPACGGGSMGSSGSSSGGGSAVAGPSTTDMLNTAPWRGTWTALTVDGADASALGIMFDFSGSTAIRLGPGAGSKDISAPLELMKVYLASVSLATFDASVTSNYGPMDMAISSTLTLYATLLSYGRMNALSVGNVSDVVNATMTFQESSANGGKLDMTLTFNTPISIGSGTYSSMTLSYNQM